MNKFEQIVKDVKERGFEDPVFLVEPIIQWQVKVTSKNKKTRRSTIACFNTRSDAEQFRKMLLEKLKKKTDIKPCPFCGRKPAVTDRLASPLIAVFCPHCDAVVSLDDSKEEAIEKWNSQALLEKL